MSWYIHRRIIVTMYHRSFQRFSSNSGGGRKRHRFPTTDELPSFKDFQLLYQFRTIFRKYLRLVKQHPDVKDLRLQIRQEFRKPGIVNDRAISEANRRYKELQNVVNASGGSNSTNTAPTDWPWTKERSKPQVFPPKTGL